MGQGLTFLLPTLWANAMKAKVPWLLSNPSLAILPAESCGPHPGKNRVGHTSPRKPEGY